MGLWWRTAVPYGELASHLQDRRMDVPIRRVVGMISAALAGIALLTLWTEGGPKSPLQKALAVTAVLCGGAGAVLWTVRWPGRRQAIAFAVIATVGVAVAALAQQSPFAAIITCTVFAATASYIALFHTAALMLAHLAVVAVVTTFVTIRLAQSTDLPSGLSAFAVIAILNLAVPFGIQLMVHALGIEAVVADFDQLTTLYNRRAFTRRAETLIAGGSDARSGCVAAVVLDLDRFKQVNDTLGHSVGDQALVAVARELKKHAAKSSIVGRIGGEEFAIVDLWSPGQVDRRALRLRRAVAGLPFGITASIGTVTADLDGASRSKHSLSDLLSTADAAMYVAKRRGGNQVFRGSITARPQEP